MAESKNNIVTHGLSGKGGDLLVFSQRNGKPSYLKHQKKEQVNFQISKKYRNLNFNEQFYMLRQ